MSLNFHFRTQLIENNDVISSCYATDNDHSEGPTIVDVTAWEVTHYVFSALL